MNHSGGGLAKLVSDLGLDPHKPDKQKLLLGMEASTLEA